MTTRHQFLAMLHNQLQPRGYLEVGVHTGNSLRLASRDTIAIGIDPAPLVDYRRASNNMSVFTMTSDAFFEEKAKDVLSGVHVDLAFIDGMHLFEFAVRDFMNIEKWANPRTVVAFDDVLPRNQAEAAREQCPGDWTGDVWKVHNILDTWRPELRMALVDTAPTGTLLVWRLDPGNQVLHDRYKILEKVFRLDQWDLVPTSIFDRAMVISPQEAMERIKGWQCAWQ